MRLTTRQKQYSSDSAHNPVNLIVHARFLLSLVELVGVIATYQSATIRMVGPFVHNIQAPSLLPIYLKINHFRSQFCNLARGITNRPLNTTESSQSLFHSCCPLTSSTSQSESGSLVPLPSARTCNRIWHGGKIIPGLETMDSGVRNNV